MSATAQRNLGLGVIGNGAFNALIDRDARVVWCCLPRPDGDPVLNALLGAGDLPDRGIFTIELEHMVRSRQTYKANTAILETELSDAQGNTVRITDFAPRFSDRGRTFRPLMLIRRITPVAGHPRIRVVLAPTFNYGATEPELTRGIGHVNSSVWSVRSPMRSILITTRSSGSGQQTSESCSSQSDSGS